MNQALAAMGAYTIKVLTMVDRQQARQKGK
jgi:hypothetical protein